MVVVAGWLILRWLHQKLWPKVEEQDVSPGLQERSDDEGVAGIGREFDLMLAPPGRLRRPHCRGAYTASLQNAENELRRKREEERRGRRTKRSRDAEVDDEWRQKELVRLHAEVKSLEAVLEIRGEEVRRLRKQLEGRERGEAEEVEMMWARVSKVAMVVEGTKVMVAATQTEGVYANQELCQSQGTKPTGNYLQQQAITKAAEEADEQEEIEGCGNVRRLKEVGRGREEDRLSLESGYFTHSDEETSSSPILMKDSEALPSPSASKDKSQIQDANHVVDPTPNSEMEKVVGGEAKPKKIHERRPSRFLI